MFRCTEFTNFKDNFLSLIPFFSFLKPQPTHHLSTLPAEVLLHILSFLDPNEWRMLSCLSRQWKIIAESDPLWRNLAVRLLPSIPNQRPFPYKRYLRDEAIRQTIIDKFDSLPEYKTLFNKKYLANSPLLQRAIFRTNVGEYLKVPEFEDLMGLPLLNGVVDNTGFGGRSLFSDRHLQSLASMNPTINCLKITGKCELTEQGLDDFLPEFVNLRVLELHGVPFVDGLLRLVLKTNLWLRSLSISSLIPLSDRSLIAIARYGKHLKKLEIIQFKATFSPKRIVTFLQDMKNLERLILGINFHFNDACLEAISQASPNIEHLSLSFCRGITLPGIQKFVARAKQLKNLSLTSCNQEVHTYLTRLKSTSTIKIHVN